MPKARAGRSVAPVSVLHELAKIMLNARGGGWKGGFVKRERKEKKKKKKEKKREKTKARGQVLCSDFPLEFRL